jgi:hypothetical protein
MTNGRSALLLVALLACCSFEWGCTRISHASAGGETNWLRRCETNKDCNAAGSCVCGLCSQRCAQDDDCSAGLICQLADSDLVSNACGSDAKSGLCSPQCRRDSDCASKQACVEHACAPAAVQGVADGGTATGTPGSTDGGIPIRTFGAADARADAEAPQPTGPETAVPMVPLAVRGRTPQAYVLSALAPDSSCVYASDNATMQVGLFDIAPRGDSTSANASAGPCAHAYRLHLKIASDEPGVLQFSGATITLMSSRQETISFDRVSPAVPNPFMYLSSMTLLPAAGGATATGIFEIEVVPQGYASQLDGFVGSQVLASISLQALDADDAPVTFRPFIYPITLCDGCLSICTTSLAPGTTRQDVVRDKCDDNSGSDNRICIDPDC